MTRDEHLLLCLAEECAEVAQRVSKALRFGLDEVQAEQPLTNRQRITEELFDLTAVATICERAGLVHGVLPNERAIQRKLDKIEKFFAISREQGTLTDTSTAAVEDGPGEWRPTLIRNEAAGFTQFVTEDVPALYGPMEARNVEVVMRLQGPRGDVLGYRIYDPSPTEGEAR